MPRFLFSIDAAVPSDAIVEKELPDYRAAKCAAVRLVAETLCDDAAEFWSVEAHKVTVSDENHLTLFTLDILATTAAVLKPMSPPGV